MKYRKNDKNRNNTDYQVTSLLMLLDYDEAVEEDDFITYAEDEIAFFNESQFFNEYIWVIRKLNRREKAILLPIFGNQLEYDKIRVRREGIGTIGGYSRGIGNTIWIDNKHIDDDGEINDDILIHEIAHVWQYQRTMGVMYAVSAVSGHLRKAMSYSTREYYDSYSFRNLEGVIPWDLWNSEAQADWVMVHRRLPPNDILRPKGIYNNIIKKRKW